MTKKSFKIPKVAIVGRSNVGKSTLFNRLVGKKIALESKEPCTTRDWRELAVNNCFALIDCAGFEKSNNPLNIEIQDNIKKLIQDEIDLLLWVIDGSQGLVADDLKLQKAIRAFNLPIWLVVNKCDNQNKIIQAQECLSLGINQVFYVSALHDKNIFFLRNKLRKKFFNSENNYSNATKQVLKFCIVGKPNVGKSSLLNTLLGRERSLTSDQPGTTRDSISSMVSGKDLNWREGGDLEVVLTDTAGMRRRAKIMSDIENYSVGQSVESIKESDIILLVIDSREGATKQDLKIAGQAFKDNKSIIIVINKCDLMKDFTEQKFRDKFLNNLQNQAKFLRFSPVIFISVKLKYNISELVSLMESIWENRNRTIVQLSLDKLLTNPSYPVLEQIEKIRQTGTNPPTFSLTNKRPLKVFEIRQIKNGLREVFELFATPLKIELEFFND